MCVCAGMCEHTYVCRHTLAEVNVGAMSQESTTVFWDGYLSLGPRSGPFYAGPIFLASLTQRWKQAPPHPAFPGMWRAELRSQCLHGKHFTQWVISLAPENDSLLFEAVCVSYLQATYSLYIPRDALYNYLQWLYNWLGNRSITLGCWPWNSVKPLK